MSRGVAYAPGSIGNVGPGFDVLGLAIGGAGVRVEVELVRGEAPPVVSIGRDAETIPVDPAKNAAAIAASALLRASGSELVPAVRIESSLPVSGGMGASGASSAAGAFAAALALEVNPSREDLLRAALEGEGAVAGRHLDNVATSILGGLVLSRSLDPIDAVALPVRAAWALALVTPRVRIETRNARGILPDESPRSEWIAQMANTTGVAAAFILGDGALLRRSLVDAFAEPRRAALIPNFARVRQAALDAGALGCSISGSGPTVFAVAEHEDAARACAEAMREAFGEIDSVAHIGSIDRLGVRRAEEESR
ncbi:MAG: homoserine kinase [Thermoanaerobaculia bacterium]